MNYGNDEDDFLLALHMNEDCVKLLLKSVEFYLEKWPGGHPSEQEGLISLQMRLRGCALEYQMRK